MPVSYTHLDVYKRQGPRSAILGTGCTIKAGGVWDIIWEPSLFTAF